MKKILILIAAVMVAATCVRAQTITLSTNAPASFFPTNSPAGPFINTLANWVTSYNTNLVWTNGFAIDTGIATTTGQKIADRLEIIDNIGSFEVGISGQFTGVGSAFNQVEGIFGYTLMSKYDFKMAVELGAGYNFDALSTKGNKGAIVIDPEIAIYKAITQNTYMTAKYGFPIQSVGKFNNLGVFYVGTGFTF